MERTSSLRFDGVCPQCGSDRIHSGDRVPGKEGDRGANRIPIDAVQHIALDNYVCLDCGYVESYIGDRGTLNRIERTWPQVPVALPPEGDTTAKDGASE